MSDATRLTYTETSNYVRAGARQLTRADADSTGPLLTGRGDDLAYRQFTPDDVLSIPMRDRSGNILGPIFPSRFGDIGGSLRWARAKNREGDHYYRTTHPKWGWPRRLQANWSRDTTDQPPVYAVAHGSGGYAFRIRVRTGPWRWRTVHVDGATYGHILSSNRYFQQAAGTDATAPLVLLSCSAAKGPAARQVATVVHANGFGGDVHAARNQVRLPADRDNSVLEVASDDTGRDWEVIESPGRSPPAPADAPAPSAPGTG